MNEPALTREQLDGVACAICGRRLDVLGAVSVPVSVPGAPGGLFACTVQRVPQRTSALLLSPCTNLTA